ncbi:MULTISPECIES: hypothetical protein [Citrobacter]|uniref:hypothetical protein n=1 Tax=Citrobacter TaxID=544 RepID=UPI000C20B682|nr:MULTISPECIES: hypothetical protein [Citrobacter]AYL04597.1 hypothetical protein D9T11_07265 [Enterobacter kobei]EKV5096053.1 hypothetical protein [Citrobacter freundii]MYL95712.1 hypothetical protein [Citrobacter werkmanii]AYL07883.1 hypothetical protein D9T11_25265 [Enterobacter kobei]MBA8128371.1 hypothetical protein [Citrobacter sp. RHBSTW-00013]
MAQTTIPLAPEQRTRVPEEQLELANYHKTTNSYRFYRRPSLLKSGPDQVTAIEVVLRLPDALGIFVLLLRL